VGASGADIGSKWTEYDMRKHIRSVIAATAPIKEGAVSPTSRLTHDLGYDSLGVVELVMMLEHELEVPEIEAPTGVAFDVVADIEDLVVGSVIRT
jgi:acyl carrier protein